MRGRIGVMIGLDLDDDAADAVHQQRRADQVGRDLMHAAGEEGALERFAQSGEQVGAGGFEPFKTGPEGRKCAGNANMPKARSWQAERLRFVPSGLARVSPENGHSMVVVVDTVSATPLRPRHPEKVNRPDALSPPKPDWIRVRAPTTRGYADTRNIVKENGLVTVCEEAGCPNIGECWDKKHATFMIMGDTCTRACAFCNVKTGMPGALDALEPEHVAEATFKLGLAHVVVTSVDRDDLADGGAEHFAQTIRAIRARCPTTTIEILTPDFLRKDGALEVVVAAKPDVFNHNLETVPSRYLNVRPGARYFHSIRLLQRVKEIDPTIFTKSGIMVGLGEERHEVLQVMDDLRSADVDFLTIGQYLQPTRKHHAVMRYVTPDEFAGYEKVAYTKGFLMVSASPLTRSSHHAGDDFARLKAARARCGCNRLAIVERM